jgi:hypothetical protein
MKLLPWTHRLVVNAKRLYPALTVWYRKNIFNGT